MPQIQYPFIDIAVHPAVRTRFAAGEAIILFSRDMTQVLWANGEGAKLFGYSDIYDLFDNGPDRTGVAFRQLAATARQLDVVGDRRSLIMRMSAGFSSQAVSAEVSLVEIRRGETVVIFSVPVAANSTFNARAAAMLKGFDDPDTHMAVVDDQGFVLAASTGFETLGILPETCRSLIAALAKGGDGLIKRPIASGAGYLPAAIGKLSIDPPLNLLFCVETVLGRMDPPQDVAEQAAALIAPGASHSDTHDVGRVEDDTVPATAEEQGEQPVEPTYMPPKSTEADLGVEDDRQEFQDAAVPDDVGSAFETHEFEEPDELAQSEIAEGAVGDNDEDVASLAVLDGASAEDVDAHVSADVETPTETVISEEMQIPAEADIGGESLGANPDEATDFADTRAASEDDAQAENENTFDAPLGEGARLDDADGLEDAPAQLSESDAPSDDSRSIAEIVAMEGSTEPEIVGDLEQQAVVYSIASVSAGQPVEAGEQTSPVAPFAFRRESRPVRFVWKLDAQGRFSEVSEEFARTVGPHAGNINGMSYRDLDSLFNLDPNNEIGALLERRDTWSGRTIRWPVEGTDLVVPVDLAALPTYSRNREFDGFRGFGIIRVSDAERDPNASGLTLGALSDDAERTAETFEERQEAVDDPSRAEDVTLTIDGRFDNVTAEELDAADLQPVDISVEESSGADFSDPSAGVQNGEPTDEFRGETPALKLESNPLANFSEKVIHLEERRAKGRDGLTPNEQNAFREIARQLEPFGKRPNETLLDPQQTPETPVEEPSFVIEPDLHAGTISDPVETQPETVPMEPVADETPQAVEDVEIGSLHDDAITENAPDALPDIYTEGGQPDEESAGDAGLTASAADQIPVAILIHAGDRLIHANSEFRRFSGYQNLEALEDAGGLDALISRREGADAGVYAIRADGAHVLVSARLQSVLYEGAKLLMLTLMPAEVQAKVEETIAGDRQTAHMLTALKVEADELRSILETATDGVVVLDADGRIRSMNRSASALFDFEDNETRGKPFAMLFAHESQKAVQDYLNGLIGHGVASVLNDGREVIGREASGGFIPLFMTMGRMPGSSSYCAVIRDITQWKRSEEELKAAKRAAETANQHKSDFLARVSHEIRTPLNAIIGFSDMIASEHFGPAGHARYVEYANDIGRSGRHVLDIVNDLLDISKIEAGEMDLEFAAVGINDCISEAVTLVQPQANGQRVIIRTSLSQSVPNVVADLRSIKQIAINILANAIRFTPSGGQIVVSTAYEPTGSVTLRIRDTGVGMSKTDLEQAMKPFGQVSPGARHRGDGTGLGLPLTRAMTEANRAMFSIQSAPNEGTLVEITFPPQRVLAD